MHLVSDPYFKEGGIPGLRRSVVVVADILGFKELNRKAFVRGEQESELRKLHSFLSCEYSHLDDPSKIKWRLKVHSDNLILGYPFLGESGEFEFAQACFSIAHYQLGMAAGGYFVRGGIGVGDLHISDTIVYGNILEEISKTEKSGTSPCVVLLASAAQYVATIDTIPHLDRILSTDQGQTFINYLGILDMNGDPTRQKLVHEHKVIIEQRLLELRKENHDDPVSGKFTLLMAKWPLLLCGKAHAHSVLEKYYWLAGYHNSFCRVSQHFNRPEFLVRT